MLRMGLRKSNAHQCIGVIDNMMQHHEASRDSLWTATDYDCKAIIRSIR